MQLKSSHPDKIECKSIKANFVLNNIRTFFNLLVPIIIFPYVSRVLGPQSLGKVEFVNSIAAYFVLFTALGIPTYGVREIARTRDSLVERSKTVAELTCVLLFTVLAGYVVYFCVIFAVPALQGYRSLFLIVCPSIALSDFSYEWFYTGIEDQSYITKRYIFTKVIQIVCVFLLIKSRSDYFVYAAITVGLNSISTFFNVFRLRKYIVFVPFKSLDIKKHLKPVLIIFASLVAVSVYMQIDLTMIGIFIDDRAVGLYTVANRIIRIIIMLLTSLGVVMIPRLENVLKNIGQEEFFKLLSKSFSYTWLFIVPSFFGIIMTAQEVVLLFGGAEYEPSVLSIQLLSPILIFVPMASIVGLQILYPMRKEFYYTISVSIAAVINIIFNWIMIQKIGFNGAIIGTCIAEFSGLLLQIFFARKYILRTGIFSANTLKVFVAGCVMFAALLVYGRFFVIHSVVIRLFVKFTVACVAFVVSLLILRETVCCELVNKIRK